MPPLTPALAILITWIPPSSDAVRASAEKAMPLLVKAASTHSEKKTCFGCHNQAFPAIAFSVARSRGYTVKADLYREQSEHIHDFLSRNKADFQSGKGTGGQVDTAGWAVHTLAILDAKPDAVTEAVAEYLLKKDADRGFYRVSSTRPPSEASSFGTGYLAVRGLQTWATEDQRERAKKRITATREWAEKTPAQDTEDRVFRLRLLKACGASETAIRDATKELAESQRFDGGWGQLTTMPSDPYATATALTALHEAGGLATDHPAYRRGLGFLIRTQLPDGSWMLKSRSKPFQPYYEGGFPHEKNQFISSSASGWAAAALWFASPPRENKD